MLYGVGCFEEDGVVCEGWVVLDEGVRYFFREGVFELRFE